MCTRSARRIHRPIVRTLDLCATSSALPSTTTTVPVTCTCTTEKAQGTVRLQVNSSVRREGRDRVRVSNQDVVVSEQETNYGTRYVLWSMV